jgi:hypothetical protein
MGVVATASPARSLSLVFVGPVWWGAYTATILLVLGVGLGLRILYSVYVPQREQANSSFAVSVLNWLGSACSFEAGVEMRSAVWTGSPLDTAPASRTAVLSCARAATA